MKRRKIFAVSAAADQRRAGEAGSEMVSAAPVAVIYTRVSTPDQVENLSLGTQERACREYCAKQGLKVDRIFVEEGQSAKSEDRDQLQALLDYCRRSRGRLGYVVVNSVSRFSRNTAVHLALKGLLLGWGIRLRSVTEPIDNTAEGELLETVLSAHSQYANQIKARASKAGMRAAFEAGGWNHRPPLGYLKKGQGHDASTIIPDPERAGLIAKAFELFATGRYTKRAVLREISALGFRTLRNRLLSSETLNSMLRNEFYAGWFVEKKWGTRSRGAHKPLVEQRVFDRVQALLEKKNKAVTPYQRNNPAFPLRGTILCGKCGRRFTGSLSSGRARRYGYYRCPTRSCSPNIPNETLENAFLAYIQRLVPK